MYAPTEHTVNAKKTRKEARKKLENCNPKKLKWATMTGTKKYYENIVTSAKKYP